MLYITVLLVVMGYLDVRYTLLHKIYVIYFLFSIFISTCSVLVAGRSGALAVFLVGEVSGLVGWRVYEIK